MAIRSLLLTLLTGLFGGGVAFAQPGDVQLGTPVTVGHSHEMRSEILDQTRRIDVYIEDPQASIRERQVPTYDVRWAADTGG